MSIESELKEAFQEMPNGFTEELGEIIRNRTLNPTSPAVQRKRGTREAWNTGGAIIAALLCVSVFLISVLHANSVVSSSLSLAGETGLDKLLPDVFKNLEPYLLLTLLSISTATLWISLAALLRNSQKKFRRFRVYRSSWSQLVFAVLYSWVIFGVLLAWNSNLSPWAVILILALFCLLWSNVRYVLISTVIALSTAVPIWWIFIGREAPQSSDVIGWLPLIILDFAIFVLIPQTVLVSVRNSLIRRFTRQDQSE